MMNRILAGLAVAAAGATLAASATAAPARSASLTIRHQMKGCHTWSLNGGPYKVVQVTRVERGGTMTVTNNDLEVQELVQTAGPPARMIRPVMSHMGAKATAVFPRRGVYRFRNEEGKPLVPDLQVMGENVLKVTVIVR
jgi:hypothetical protein